jgi:transcriptional regulator with PAS, ATPase and Fis domain
MKNVTSLDQITVEVTPAKAKSEASVDIPGLRSFGPIKTGAAIVISALEEAALFAASDISILLHGESGTGKELFAEYIHQNSNRRGARLVVINGAALPETLAEALLFGYEKGAFTGAHSAKEGLIEAAQGGTVFLDEVGDLPLAIQTKLLRVVQSRQLMRVGSTTERHIDVRFVFASHKDIGAMVEKGTFREDLFYRIQEATIFIPPLRERGEDAVLLAQLFAKKFAPPNRRDMLLSIDAESAIRSHEWPGNVRELQSALRRASIVARGEPITAHHLHIHTLHHPGVPIEAATTAEAAFNAHCQSGTHNAAPTPTVAAEPAAPTAHSPMPSSLAEARKEEDAKRVIAALQSVNGNVSSAAELFGVSRPTIYNILRRQQPPATVPA